MSYFYSPSENSFYPESLFQAYEDAGTLPSDLKAVTDGVFFEFSGGLPDGMVRSAGSDGMPEWAAPPPPPQSELVENASSQKKMLIIFASNKIDPLQDAMDLEIATDDELAQLKAWKTYRVMLNRVDVNTAPDINWPVPPDAPK